MALIGLCAESTSKHVPAESEKDRESVIQWVRVAEYTKLGYLAVTYIPHPNTLKSPSNLWGCPPLSALTGCSGSLRDSRTAHNKAQRTIKNFEFDLIFVKMKRGSQLIQRIRAVKGNFEGRLQSRETQPIAFRSETVKVRQ